MAHSEQQSTRHPTPLIMNYLAVLTHRNKVLEGLPPETLEHILSNLDAKDVATCKRLSRSFRDLITNSVRLQYKIECFLARVEDNPRARPEVTTRQRLHSVREWHKAYATCQWSGQSRITIPPVPENENEEHRVDIGAFGPVFVLQVERSLTIVQPPSPHRFREEKRWAIEDVGFTPAAFAYDHGEQVLVVAEKDPNYTVGYRLHILSLAGTPHPAAASQILLADLIVHGYNDGWQKPRCRISILEDLMLVEVNTWNNSDDFELRVFNWKRGRLLLHTQGSMEHLQEPHGAEFLDHDHLLLPMPSPPSEVFERWPGAGLAVVRIPPHDPDLDAEMEPRDETAERTVCFLEFPEEVELAAYQVVRVRGQPPRTTGAIDSDGIFFHRPDTTMVVVSFYLHHGHGGPWERPHSIAFPREYVLSLLPAASDASAAPIVIAWESWAPYARLFYLWSDHDVISNSFKIIGSRYLHLVPDEETETLDEDPTAFISVLDFAAQGVPYRAFGEDPTTEPDTIVEDESFVCPVTFGQCLHYQAGRIARKVGKDFLVGEDFIVFCPYYPHTGSSTVEVIDVLWI